MIKEKNYNLSYIINEKVKKRIKDKKLQSIKKNTIMKLLIKEKFASYSKIIIKSILYAMTIDNKIYYLFKSNLISLLVVENKKETNY